MPDVLFAIFVFVVFIILGWIFNCVNRAHRLVMRDLNKVHDHNMQAIDYRQFEKLLSYDALNSYDGYLVKLVTFRDPRKNYSEYMKEVLND